MKNVCVNNALNQVFFTHPPLLDMHDIGFPPVELYKIVVKLPPNAAVDIGERRDAAVAHEVLLQIHQNLVLSPAQARRPSPSCVLVKL